MFLFLYETTTIPLSNHHRTYVLPCSFRPSRYFPTRYVLLRSLNPYTSEHASGFPTLLFLLITRLPFLNPPLSKNPSKLIKFLLGGDGNGRFFVSGCVWSEKCLSRGRPIAWNRVPLSQEHPWQEPSPSGSCPPLAGRPPFSVVVADPLLFEEKKFAHRFINSPGIYIDWLGKELSLLFQDVLMVLVFLWLFIKYIWNV